MFEEGLSFPYLEAIDEGALSFQDWKTWYFEDREVSQFDNNNTITPMINNIGSQSENEAKATFEDKLFDSENLNVKMCHISNITYHLKSFLINAQ